jgi:predicted metal-dependent hydrolase
MPRPSATKAAAAAQQLSLFDAPAPAVVPVPSAAPTETTPKPKSNTKPTAPAAGPVLQLPGLQLPYTLSRSRRRTIGFSIGTQGLRVAAPKWVTLAEIDSVLQGRSDWISRKWREVQGREQRLAALKVQWQDGAELPFLGGTLRLRLGPTLRHDEPQAELWLPLPPSASDDQWRDTVQAWLQTQARTRFAPRLAHFAAQAEVATPKLRLSGAHTRWGSASSRGVVSLNWRLVHFSPSVIDYVIAHEVAHLVEMNHGPKFWTVVGQLLPGFEVQREQLREALVPPL